MLRHLLDIEHLQRTETGRLIIGLEAESIVNNYRFYSVFMVADEYRVRDKSCEIGTIPARQMSTARWCSRDSCGAC